MDQSAAQLVGAVFNGRWRLTRLLGEGGMGAVYEAQGVRGEGTRALKVLHPEFIHEPQILERFLAEAETAKSLEHPNVARVFEYATAEDGSPYLVMELLQGNPLTSWLDQGNPMPPQQAATIAEGILQALALAHARKVVHRDLKPDNLFLVPDGQGGNVVKVLDFGIAKVMDAAGGMGNKTKTGVLLGTPGYMSPEQIRNSKGVDPRSDLWSVGIILYEMLTAKEPFPADNEFARLTAVLTDPIVPIEQAAPQLASWSGFFQRALAKELEQRFASAAEMSQALRAVAWGAAPQSAAMSQAAGSQAAVSTAAASRGPGSQQLVTQALSADDLVPPRPASQAPPTAPAAQPGPSAGASRGGEAATYVSGERPAGMPNVPSIPPNVEVVPAPPVPGGAPWWVVGVVGFVCLGLGFVVGFLTGG